MACANCRARDASTGVLCSECAERVSSVRGVCPEQIVSSVTSAENAALIDKWGRVHYLAAVTQVGRGISVNAIAIFNGIVSRTHAELARTNLGWQLRDLGSANGTALNGRRIEGAEPVAPGDQLSVGGVGFYFCEDARSLRAEHHFRDIETVNAIEVDGVVADFSNEVTSEHLLGTAAPEGPLRLFEPVGGGGGVVEFENNQAQLGEAQFALLSVLFRRLTNEQDRPEVIRGFIRSSELLQLLPWDTPHPSDNHLKQLVRRTRRTLSSAGISGIIESRQRFGYRLRLSEEK